MLMPPDQPDPRAPCGLLQGSMCTSSLSPLASLRLTARPTPHDVCAGHGHTARGGAPEAPTARDDGLQEAFALLGLTSTGTDFHSAKTAYFNKIREHHPDKNRGDVKNATEAQQINDAWDVIKKHFEERERQSEQPKPKKQRTEEQRTKCTPALSAQAASIMKLLGLDVLLERGKGGPKKKETVVEIYYRYVVPTKAKELEHVKFTAEYPLSIKVNKNHRFNCGTYRTQEEAAIAANLCKKRLKEKGVESYKDLEKMPNFESDAFAKDIQDEVEKAINDVLSGETSLLTTSNNESV